MNLTFGLPKSWNNSTFNCWNLKIIIHDAKGIKAQTRFVTPIATNHFHANVDIYRSCYGPITWRIHLTHPDIKVVPYASFLPTIQLWRHHFFFQFCEIGRVAYDQNKVTIYKFILTQMDRVTYPLSVQVLNLIF